MRRQRLAYTLPMQNDFIIPPEEDDARNIFQSQLQDPESSIELTAPDVSSSLYQYPVVPISQEPFQSFTSIFSNQSYQFIPYGNFEDFRQWPLEMENAYNSPPILDYGHGDGALHYDMYPREEPPTIQLHGYLHQELTNPNPFVTNYGTLTVFLRHLIRVDISADKSVFLTHLPSECAAVVNSSGDRSGIIHPNGRVFHDANEIHMATLDKVAKICNRGVVFTSKNHCLSYLVDASGTKTTTEKFRDLGQDFSYSIFNFDLSEVSLEQCRKMAEESVHKRFRNGDEVWMIGGIRIKQDQWGDVKVSRFRERMAIKISPTAGRISLNTQDLEISLSRYHNNYFSVRKGCQYVTASLKGFNVQSGNQKAGFNTNGKLVIK